MLFILIIIKHHQQTTLYLFANIVNKWIHKITKIADDFEFAPEIGLKYIVPLRN